MAQPARSIDDDVQVHQNLDNLLEPASNNIQNFGFLVALIVNEDNVRRLVVNCASDNSATFTGYSPDDLFGLEDFGSILERDDVGTLMAQLGLLREEKSNVGATGGRAVFNLLIIPKQGEATRFWCSMHLTRNSPGPETIVCEFEPHEDGSATPVGQRSYTSDVATKTPRMSRRVGKDGVELSTMQAIGIMSEIQASFAAIEGLAAVPEIIVTTVEELTGFDRVVLYRIDEFMAITIRDTSDREWQGSQRCIHFTKLPRARNVNHQSPFSSQLRILHDNNANPARLVYRSAEFHQPGPIYLDRSYLNRASPTFFEELAAEDSKARSFLTIPVNAFGKRWGLVVCYGYSPEGTRLPMSKRQMCEFIGSTSGVAIERLSYASMLVHVESSQAQRESIRYPTEGTAASQDLLHLFGADFALTSTRGEIGKLGEPSKEVYQEATAIVRCIQPYRGESVIISTDVTTELPNVGIAASARTISGLLWAPLSTSSGDFVVFFRFRQPTSPVPRDGASSSLESDPQPGTQPALQWSDRQVRMATALGSLGRQLPLSQLPQESTSVTVEAVLSLARIEPHVYSAVGSIVESLDDTLQNLGKKHAAYDNVNQAYFSSRALEYLLNDLRC
ncbi:phytochrome-1 [Colletotrichum simmondsii]|uniref:Phytochrome-1 n=1 Tax=Colletotrichum simmondsii TaxID=703756 RepID=A0A135TMR0_9PEZI|nr:phytochrome-1 [Colletotrichum simmondsii]